MLVRALAEAAGSVAELYVGSRGEESCWMDFQGLMYGRVFCTGSSRPPPVMLVACRGTTLLVLRSAGGAGGSAVQSAGGPRRSFQHWESHAL